jgi:hypothetical protein
MRFHFGYSYGYLPAFPRYEGRVVKHHLFPQAQEFREWFRRARIDIHEYTLVIPEHIHLQIHRGTVAAVYGMRHGANMCGQTPCPQGPRSSWVTPSSWPFAMS